jgi:hypothetical protein
LLINDIGALIKIYLTLIQLKLELYPLKS